MAPAPALPPDTAPPYRTCVAGWQYPRAHAGLARDRRLRASDFGNGENRAIPHFRLVPPFDQLVKISNFNRAYRIRVCGIVIISISKILHCALALRVFGSAYPRCSITASRVSMEYPSRSALGIICSCTRRSNRISGRLGNMRA